MMLKPFGCLLLAATATAGQWEFKDIRGPADVSGPRRYQVYSAVAVGRRTLAALEVWTLDPKEKKRLKAEHGFPNYFVLAWLNPSWAVRETSEPFFFQPGDMTPISSDLSRIEYFFAPALFPKVLVLDGEEWQGGEEEEKKREKCPYLLVFPSKFSCFNSELKITATYELPFVMNNLRVVEGEVWVVGVWQDHLIHRWDFQKHQLVEHRLPLQQLRKAMEQAGLKEEEMASVTSPGTELRKIGIPGLEKEATTPLEEELQRHAREFTLPVATLPTSFLYDVAVQGSRAAVVLRKPMGLWVTGWPEGKKSSFIRVKAEDLPALPERSTRLYLLGLEAVGKGEFFAAFQVHSTYTFAQALVEDPQSALEYQKQQGRQIAPDELAGLDLGLLGVKFSDDKVAETWFQSFAKMEKWEPYHLVPIFAYRPQEAWIGIRGKGENKRLRGIGRLE